MDTVILVFFVCFTTMFEDTISSAKSSIIPNNDVITDIPEEEDLPFEQNLTSINNGTILVEGGNATNTTATAIDPGGRQINTSSNSTGVIEDVTILNETDNVIASTKNLNNASDISKSQNENESSLPAHLVKDFKFSAKYRKMVELMHIESIKARLLAKLRLDSPPKRTGTKPSLPLQVLQRELISDEGRRRNQRKSHDFYAKSVQIFVTGTDVTSECSNRKGAACYYFDLEGKVSANEVYKAELWAYKLYNHNDPYIQKFVVSELNRQYIKRRPKKMVARMQFRKKQGWVKVDLKRSVLHWLRHPKKNFGVAVVCSTCYRKNRRSIFSTKADTRPFLVITKRQDYNHERPKRSGPRICTETSTDCCLKPLTINLNELGWTGMVYPNNIEANYCIGSCHAQEQAHYNHTQLMQNYRWNLNDVNMLRQLTPCCAPISYGSLALMYRINNGLEVVRIPNIVATACGCV